MVLCRATQQKIPASRPSQVQPHKGDEKRDRGPLVHQIDVVIVHGEEHLQVHVRRRDEKQMQNQETQIVLHYDLRRVGVLAELVCGEFARFVEQLEEALLFLPAFVEPVRQRLGLLREVAAGEEAVEEGGFAGRAVAQDYLRKT